jgi:MoxR-like ATPase
MPERIQERREGTIVTIYNQPEYPKFDRTRMRGRENVPYLPDEGLLAAANIAYARGRPLLLTGEPGCGKTDFAYAAASGLWRGDERAAEAQPLEFYVRSDTTARDLLYRYDTVRRFSDAQTGDEAARRRARLAQNFVTLEALGQGLTSATQRVVLIDEIDKAQRDLPNDLLRELDQARFEIPEIVSAGSEEDVLPEHRHIERKMGASEAAPRPFVVITSNVERQLPDAFLRRCIFYYVPFPDKDLLEDILDERFGKPADETHRDAVAVFEALRGQSLTKKPATAELIDWVAALRTVFAPDRAWEKVRASAAKIRAETPINWMDIDGIPALVKLREDIAALQAMHSRSRTAG